MTKHFEEVWEEAEKIAPPKRAVEDILADVSRLLKDYAAIDEHPVAEQAAYAKNKIYGQVLLHLANLSLTDNIDVFKSLQEAIKFSKL